MKRKVTVKIDDEIQTHIAGDSGAGYATLCGLDGNDSGVGQSIIATPPNSKVDCQACFSIWEEARQWKRSDFS